MSEKLWYDNTECAMCGKPIEDLKKFRACETGYSYCSEECAVEHVRINEPSEGY